MSVCVVIMTLRGITCHKDSGFESRIPPRKYRHRNISRMKKEDILFASGSEREGYRNTHAAVAQNEGTQQHKGVKLIIKLSPIWFLTIVSLWQLVNPSTRGVDEIKSANVSRSLPAPSWRPTRNWIDNCVRKFTHGGLQAYLAPELRWPLYALESCIRSCRSCVNSKAFQNETMCVEIISKNDSFAAYYYERLCKSENNEDLNLKGDLSIVDSILNLGEKQGFAAPSPGEVVIYLPLRDLIEQSEVGVADILNEGGSSSHARVLKNGITSISDYLATLETTGNRRVRIRDGFLMPPYYEKSHVYRFCLVDALQYAGYDVDLSFDGATPGEDFFFGAKATQLIVAPGEFSRLMGEVVERHGGIVHVLPRHVVDSNSLPLADEASGASQLNNVASSFVEPPSLFLEQPTKATKVFGLGLSKHATTSMGHAMVLLGYKNTIHNDRRLAPFMHHPELPVNLTGYYDDTDSVWDIPTAVYYRELHKAYPDAKFILTTRDADAWLTSFQAYQEEYQRYRFGCVTPERQQRLHEYVYGTRQLTSDWIKSLQNHNKDVIKHFKDFPGQLLVLDIEKDDLWAGLCEFLMESTGPCERHTMGQYPPFPRSNNKTANTASITNFECPSPKTSEAALRSHSHHAYVLLLCDQEGNQANEFLMMVLVLAESIRRFDRTNDIVVLVKGNLYSDTAKFIRRMGMKVLRVKSVGTRVPIEDPFHKLPHEFTRCANTKIRILQLLHYDRVMFVDADIVFQENPQVLFDEPGFVGFDGPKSPFNAGLFVVTPSQQAFVDMQDIANSGSFDPKDGWLHYGEFPHWREEGKMHNWTFWGSHTDQGLFYYYYHILKDEANIRSNKEFDFLFIHFSGTNKPFLKDRSNLSKLRRRFQKPTAYWYKLWDQVVEKVGSKDAEKYFGGRASL